MRTYFLLLLLIVQIGSCQSLIAQDNGVLRVELEAKRNSEAYNVVPVGADGVIVFYESDERGKRGSRLWVFTKYDTNFKEVWTKEFPVNKSMSYSRYQNPNNTTLYLMLRDAKNFQFLLLDIKSGNITTKFAKATEYYSLNSFKTINDNLFILGETYPKSFQNCAQICFTLTCIPLITGATVYKENAVLQKFNLTDGDNRSIFVNPKGKSSIIGAEVESGKFLNVLIRKVPNRKISQVFKYRYGEDGNLISTSEIKSSIDKEVISGRLKNYNNASEVLIGTYSKVEPGKRKRIEVKSAHGVYFTKFKNNEQEFIKYYDFTKFNSFLDTVGFGFFGKGYKITSVSYQLLVHDIIKRNGEYIMVAEAYYPQYHSETYTSFDANGRAVTQTRQVFDGYRYTKAIIAGFDEDGNLLWDNSFEMGDILSYQLIERVKLLISDKEIAMIYSWGGQVLSKIISGNEVIESKTSTKIDTKNQDDQVKNTYGSDVLHWYGNYFISFGYQVIKSDREKDKGGNKKRSVFYFNKIGYQ